MQQLSLSEFPLIISWVNLKIKKKKSVRKREQKFVKLCGPQRSLVEQGGSGHVWLFFNDPVPGGNQAAQQDVFDCRVRGAVKRFPLYNKILLPINPSSLLMILLFIFQAPPLLKKKKTQFLASFSLLFIDFSDRCLLTRSKKSNKMSLYIIFPQRVYKLKRVILISMEERKRKAS